MKVLRVLRRVFVHFRYIQVVVIAAFIIMSAALLLPSRDVIYEILSIGSLSLGAKLSFVVSLYGSFFSKFTIFSGGLLLLTAVLFGVNLSLLLYYIRRRQTGRGRTTAPVTSVGGMVAGVLGIGCAACGSLVITSALTLFGAGGLLLALPLHGAEFGIVGVLLLSFSIVQLTHRIDDPLVCVV